MSTGKGIAKKALALFLAMAMAFGGVPVNALGDEGVAILDESTNQGDGLPLEIESDDNEYGVDAVVEDEEHELADDVEVGADEGVSEGDPVLLVQESKASGFHYNNANGHLYRTYVSDSSHLNWYNARDRCWELGGHLATITSAQEEDFIIQKGVMDTAGKNDRNVWTGAEFPGDTVDSICWYNGEDNSYKPARLFDITYWKYRQLSGFVCEWEPDEFNLHPYRGNFCLVELKTGFCINAVKSPKVSMTALKSQNQVVAGCLEAKNMGYAYFEELSEDTPEVRYMKIGGDGCLSVDYPTGSVVVAKGTPVGDYSIKILAQDRASAGSVATVNVSVRNDNPITISVPDGSDSEDPYPVDPDEVKKRDVIIDPIKTSNEKTNVVYVRVTKFSSKRIKVVKRTGKIIIKKGTKPGKYKVKVKISAAGNSKYLPASKTVTIWVVVGHRKAKNPMKVKVKKKRVKYAKVRKKKATFSLIKVKKAKGKVRYKRIARGSSKRLKINKKTGKVTVRKGTKPGTYKMRVKVTAAGNAKYKKASKTVTVRVIVKASRKR